MKKNFKENINNNQKPQNKKNKTSETKKIVFKVFITLFLFFVFSLMVYIPLQQSGALNKIKSVEELKAIILNSGVWGYLIFFAIQFIQVTFIPIPAAVTTVAGALVFGPWPAFFISLVSILLASCLSFWIGRKFGTKVVYWIVGKEQAQKYNQKLKRGKYVFFLMMLFPGFPDDILCLLAGMTTMSFKFFLTTNLITRPIVIFALVFFGSGLVIPFSGWGIYAWAALAIFMLFAFYISVKKQQQIENFLFKLANKFSKKEKEVKEEKIETTKKD